ncbi:DUF6344 domain-containing protein [Streptomyces sp. NPDC002812]|uniref:DUF6344 domain-containing protein n=1 Tax=unclassified Streptomyces TaxID=2593676 RepID=UPI0022513D10|nr:MULTISPECIES: DUF6344 domain-containing protein [unclassified Streptomyces]MCX5124093.1 DUF6344 domain-containing protein [Streptomyces sp. NBC_00347]MCX5297338.1 DUF6344 domain-containing protein [Streptomyces sp. NBC_00193]
MAHRSTITSIWTTVLAALVALLASLGFGGKAAQAAATPLSSSPAAAPAAVAAHRPAFMARRTWRAMMRGGSLPPTIKQRIRAEAHGKTPSVRRSTTALSAGSGTGSGSGSEFGVDDSVRSAAIAAAVRVGAARREMALAA